MDCRRVLNEHGTLWLIVGDQDDEVPIVMAPQRLAMSMGLSGWVLVQEIHWVKNYRVPGRVRDFGHPESTTEKVYMLAKTYDYYYNDQGFGNAWNISPARHIARKWAVLPNEIVERCVICGSLEGDIVLDPFSGSGTVPRVASGLGRVGIGSDVNPT